MLGLANGLSLARRLWQAAQRAPQGLLCKDSVLPLYLTYLLLILAIIAEVIATTALARSGSFTRLVPSVITVVGYVAAFWLLSFPIRVLPTGIVYAIWSGVGIVLITGISWAWYGQKLDMAAIIGLALIMLGVAVVNVFSKTVVH